MCTHSRELVNERATFGPHGASGHADATGPDGTFFQALHNDRTDHDALHGKQLAVL